MPQTDPVTFSSSKKLHRLGSEWQNKDLADTELRDDLSCIFRLVPGRAGPWCFLHQGCVLLLQLLLLKWSDFGVADGTAQFLIHRCFLAGVLMAAASG